MNRMGKDYIFIEQSAQSSYVGCGVSNKFRTCGRFMVNMNSIIIGQDHFAFHTIAKFLT